MTGTVHGVPEDELFRDGRSHEEKGVVELLDELFGHTVNAKGYKVLDQHIGVIYGDSITLDRARRIYERLAAKGYASDNIVLGIGSYTYQYMTRDNLGSAVKATWALVDGEPVDIQKDPKTGSGKKSAKGRIALHRDASGEIRQTDQASPEDEASSLLQTVWPTAGSRSCSPSRRSGHAPRGARSPRSPSSLGVTEAPAATRDQPLIAIDVVPVSFTTADGLRVATARRAYDPYAGREALPGVLLGAAERLVDGARARCAPRPGSTRLRSGTSRRSARSTDPRATRATRPSASRSSPSWRGVDAPTAVWNPVGGAEPGLPFDHDAIVRTAVDQVRTRLWRDVALTRALLGEVFTTSAAAQLHTALHGAAPDAGNLNRALRTNPTLVRTDAALASTGRGGRPPATWTWVD